MDVQLELTRTEWDEAERARFLHLLFAHPTDNEALGTAGIGSEGETQETTK